MKNLLTTILLCGSALWAAPGLSAQYGGQVDRQQLTAISSIVANPERYLATPVTVQGEIISVCQEKGCWMQLASDVKQQQFKIKVRDGEMVFPLSAKGKQAIATGRLVRIELDLESTREHLAELAEREGRDFDASTVSTPLVLLQLTPTAVEIAD